MIKGKTKIIKKGSKDVDSEDDDLDLVEKGRTFFCSELIAKAYKVSGIMESTDQACTNFLPASFSTKK